jgi:hypothetical protein
MKTIASITKSLRGKVGWGVEWEPQLNLSMSFGAPQLRIREPHVSRSRNQRVREQASHRHVTVKGKWWLWVFCAYWRIHIPHSATATSSSPLRLKRKAMAGLSGQRLQRIRVNPIHGATEFLFDLGAILEVRRFEESDADMWTLYQPNGYVLGVMGNGTFTNAIGTTPGQKLVPMTLNGANNQGGANGRQPFRSGRVRTPSAAASRRSP